MKPLSRAVGSVPASGIRRFFDLVAEMDDVISLGVGHIRCCYATATEKLVEALRRMKEFVSSL